MTKKKILIVDDEKSVTEMVREYLEQTERFEAREENLGAQVLEAAREFRPDLILMDEVMPDLNGNEVYTRLRKDGELQGIPVIFLTGLVTKNETEAQEGMIAGHVFIAKPIIFEELTGIIDKHL